MTVRIASILISASLLTPCALISSYAQAAADGTPAKPALSAQLAPAMEQLQQAVAGVRLEKWKSSGALKDDTDTSLASIRHDLDATLPGLVSASDAAPASLTAMLPVTRNIDALYDVLLRVTERAKSFAPQPQSAALEQSLKRLEDARRGLYENLASLASAQDQQIQQLKQALVAAQNAPPPVVTAPPAKTAPAVKPKPKAKPKTTPAAATTGSK